MSVKIQGFQILNRTCAVHDLLVYPQPHPSTRPNIHYKAVAKDLLKW